MKNWVKYAIGVGIVGGAASYILKLRKTAVELEMVNSTMLHKVDFSGIYFKVNTLIKNPTKGTLTIKQPFVKLIYKEATIGSSQTIDKDIQIPSFGQVQLDPIMIQVPINGLFSLGADLLKVIKGSNEPVKMQIKTMTVVDLGFKKLPFEKVDDVTLKK